MKENNENLGQLVDEEIQSANTNDRLKSTIQTSPLFVSEKSVENDKLPREIKHAQKYITELLNTCEKEGFKKTLSKLKKLEILYTNTDLKYEFFQSKLDKEIFDLQTSNEKRDILNKIWKEFFEVGKVKEKSTHK